MKKIFALVLAAVLIFCAGCGKSKKQYDYDLSKYVTLPEYKNINIDASATDYQVGVAYARYSMLNQLDGIVKTETLKTGKVQAADTVNIAYEGKLNGVAFDGGTSDDYDLEIGSGSFIDGFETGLIGVEIGETVDLNLTFPESYNSAELAGKSVVFTVTVKGITRPILPEITVSLAQQFGYNSVEEFEKNLSSSYLNNLVWGEVMKNAKVLKYPETEINEYIDNAIESLRAQYETGTTTLEDVLSQNGMTLETYKTYLKSYAEADALQKMVVFSIARNEKFTASDEEISNYISSNNLDSAKKADKDEAEFETLKTKVLDFLVQNAKITNP